MLEPGEENLAARAVDQVSSAVVAKEVQQAPIGREEGGEGGLLEGLGLLNLGGKHGKHRGHRNDGEVRASLSAMFAIGDDERESQVITGMGDRARHLAMVNGNAVPQAARSYVGKTPILDKSKPASRGDCERRCGSDGFCDPSSPKGCGGMYCLEMG